MTSTACHFEMSRRVESRRGSVLVIALMMAVILGTVLGSYLNMALSQLKLANEQKYKLEAQRQAESAIEKGLFSLNNEFSNISGTPSTYNGTYGTWNLDFSTDTATLVLTETLLNNRTAYTTIVVENFLRDRNADGDILANVTAETVIKDSDNNLVQRRRITADLEPRSYLPYGITTRDYFYPVWRTIRATGFVPRTPGGYDVKVGGSYDYLYDDDVGTTDDEMILGAGRYYSASSAGLELYGKLITTDFDADRLSSTTTIRDDYSLDPHSNPIDYGLYYDGFTENFPDLDPGPLVNSNVIDLPNNWGTLNLGQTPDAGYDPETGIYHYTLSDHGSESDLTIESGQKFQIFGPTVIYAPNDMEIEGQIVIKGGGSLTLFVEDDLDIYYGKIVNETADPSKLTIISTQTSTNNTASWYMYHDDPFHGSLYGNRVDLTMVGKEWGLNGTFYGAAMVRNMYTYGSLEFYYDKSLSQNFVRNNQTLDHELKFTPINWTEENSDSYLAGDPNP